MGQSRTKCLVSPHLKQAPKIILVGQGYANNCKFKGNSKDGFAIKYLSAAGFGAKLLGVFGNGMVQSFIHARTLTPSDMRKPKLASEIAKQLRSGFNIYLLCFVYLQLLAFQIVLLVWSFDSLCLLLTIVISNVQASSLQFEDTDKQKIYETISFEEVHKEATQLKELTGLLNAPVVFAHNDLLSGNLMRNDEQVMSELATLNKHITGSDKGSNTAEKLYIIDFEYGSYNYRGFDIGNHFNEYAGYDCDYSLYPCKDEQYHFFRHYLQPEKPYKVSEKDLEALYVEANTLMLASHLYWALWSLIQARMSPIDFDYIEYFFLRYNEY
ncbi:putative ethanolamine kinase [Hibiscus syriacus]|uniref:ethanolamine kinase n=1 Tax=Hibiscus syriacus TaxID=106335 RepID=A0A6A3BQS5_HIBSY|nr:putative ethanolamine kinase [Hibiscus syriacus]